MWIRPSIPVQVDEGAEVDDVRDRAFDDVAGRELVEDRLPHLLALVFEHGSARQDDVVPTAVELDDLAAKLAPEEVLEVLDPADVDERGRQEAAHAEVEDQAALDDLDHGAVDGLAALGGVLDALPGHLEAGALLRQDQTPFGVLLRHDERVDLVAELDLVVGVDRATDRQLGHGDDALGLVADVDQDLVLVDPDDRAPHDLSLVDHENGRVVVRDQRAVFGTDPARVDRVCLSRGFVGHAERRILAASRRLARPTRAGYALASVQSLPRPTSTTSGGSSE